MGSRGGIQPCDINEILRHGDTASYYIYNKLHNEYMSTDGRNVDLWRSKGTHALWHLKHVAGHTANRFYLQNDWAGSYLSSNGNHNLDNVKLWGGRDHRSDGFTSH